MEIFRNDEQRKRGKDSLLRTFTEGGLSYLSNLNLPLMIKRQYLMSRYPPTHAMRGVVCLGLCKTNQDREGGNNKQKHFHYIKIVRK